MNGQSQAAPVELSLVSPMYNEADGVDKDIPRFVQALEALGVTWELILVNDGSTDKTYDLAKKHVDGDSRLRLVSYPNNCGRGYAMRAGIRQSRGKYVITTEADLSWGQDIVKNLLDELKRTGADIVIASPYLGSGSLQNVPFMRALLSKGANVLLRRSISQNVTMLSGMTRGYKGDGIRALPLEEDGKEIHLEIASKASALGFRFSEIPATLTWDFSPERRKRAGRITFKTVKLIVSHLLFGFSESPALLFGTVGSFLFGLGMLLGLFLFGKWAILGETVGDRTALILTTVFLLLSGLQALFFYFVSHQNRHLKRDVLFARKAIQDLGNQLEKKNTHDA